MPSPDLHLHSCRAHFPSHVNQVLRVSGASSCSLFASSIHDGRQDCPGGLSHLSERCQRLQPHCCDRVRQCPSNQLHVPSSTATHITQSFDGCLPDVGSVIRQALSHATGGMYIAVLAGAAEGFYCCSSHLFVMIVQRPSNTARIGGNASRNQVNAVSHPAVVLMKMFQRTLTDVGAWVPQLPCKRVNWKFTAGLREDAMVVP
mmetsp:Transcript_5005/g.10949  ORF Transcript_5005/g.10949 Transcript_5005/m.10949 type:complete len:203 (+) Transcript_5005:1324-1932(+)